ncbi:MAG: hypothetical protein OXH60_07790 [Rhodospirillales bacterium]|nr:hypothetical protein [Rhodospirillales bacterium]
MKFDPGKAWPHPVLRPSNFGDDYPEAEFEVDIRVTRTIDSTAVEIESWFELSDPSLLALLDNQRASFALLVRSPKTHYRQMLQSFAPKIAQSFPSGALSGRVELAPFLVCVKALQSFRADGWHPDFGERSFTIDPGTVLAEDVSKDYWIDTADEAPLGSIFGHKVRTDLVEGRWEYEIAEDRIWIVMSNANTEQFQSARKLADNQPESQYLMNGLYLPALVALLNDVDQNAEDYRDFRWFSSLDHRLEAVGCLPLGGDSSNRLVDAQKILDSPFPRMPLIAGALEASS